MALTAITFLGAFVAPASAQSSAEAGRFVVVCGHSHTSMDDPIVFPGQPGAAHIHDFFGNESTDAFSTTASLMASPASSCDMSGDASAYWAPALIVDGAPVTPTVARLYYSSGGKDPATVRPPPHGLEMIAGDSRASSPQPFWVTTWYCVGQYNGSVPASAPYCADGRRVVLNVTFPDCWNGRTLDSADHKSHLTYARRASADSVYTACPASHPAPIPSITMKVVYPTSGAPSGVELASGGLYSAHADFLDGWTRHFLGSLVRRCIQAAVDCAA